MNWEQRKIYVAATVKTCKTVQKTNDENEESRRFVTLKHNLIVGNEHVPIRKKMFLNSLCLGKWTARSWALEAENSMTKSQERNVESRNKCQGTFIQERFFETIFDEIEQTSISLLL